MQSSKSVNGSRQLNSMMCVDSAPNRTKATEPAFQMLRHIGLKMCYGWKEITLIAISALHFVNVVRVNAAHGTQLRISIRIEMGELDVEMI